MTATEQLTVLNRCLRSELHKLPANRALAWTVAVVIIISGVAAALVSNASLGSDLGVGTTQSVLALFTGYSIVPYAAAFLGCAAVTSEFGSGVSRSIYTCVPQRWPVVLGKAVVFTVVGLGLACFSLAAAWAGLALQADGSVSAAMTPSITGALLGGVAAGGALGALGVAVGFLTRRPQAGIVVLILLLIVAPVIGGSLSVSLPTLSSVADWLPIQAANTLVDATGVGGTSRAVVAVIAISAWAVGGLSAGTWAVRRSDL